MRAIEYNVFHLGDHNNVTTLAHEGTFKCPNDAIQWAEAEIPKRFAVGAGIVSYIVLPSYVVRKSPEDVRAMYAMNQKQARQELLVRDAQRIETMTRSELTSFAARVLQALDG